MTSKQRNLKKVKRKRSGDAGPRYTSAWRMLRVIEFSEIV